MKPCFLEYELAQGSLYTHWEKFTPRHLVIWSLSYCCTQVGIITGQYDLQEVVIVQLAVIIEIEVGNCVCKVSWLHLSEAIFPLELGELLRIDCTSVSSVDPFEGRVWFEVPHRSKYLTKFLDRYLLLCVVDEDLFYFQL